MDSAMSGKRSVREMGTDGGSDQDPDYVMVTSTHPPKKQKLHQQDAKDTTVKKIEAIIKKQFAIEIKNKEKEIELADERIHQVRLMLDKLRACVVANYYGNAGIYPGTEKSKQKVDLNHPAIQRALGNGKDSKPGSESTEPKEGLLSEIGKQNLAEDVASGKASLEVKNGDRTTQLTSNSGQGSRFHVKKRIIVGNVSKYITTDNREESDPSTHKWMVYVRGPPDEPRIDHFVKKVWFYLHPSYRPNDLVEVKDPPFHLTRRGWGEFPIRVQLHFNDPRSKKVDIIHHLKLDRTYTGLQTLGAETIVDVELDRYLFDEGESSGSRPSTPTVTKVNYREGFKAGLSRTPPSLRSSPSIFSTKSSSPLNSDDQQSTPASSPISGSSHRGTPVTLDDSHGVSSRPSTPSPSLSNKVTIQSGMIVSSSRKSPDPTEGKFVQVLPSQAGASTASAITKNSRSLQDLPKLSLSSSLTPSLTPGVKKVADGKSALSWRIEEGKLLEVPQRKAVSSPKTALSMSLVPPLPGTTSTTASLSKPRAKLPSLKAISSTKASTSTSQMTLLGRQTVKSLLGTPKGQSTSTSGIQVVSNTPGAQYYITAKSTDPNLQGKVILIPHQVFAQAQGPGGSKTTTAKTTTKASGKGKSSFLSPSNVLILPQGSIVPPLPPGSIVQIQQVPSPARTTQSQSKQKTTTNLIRTGITSAKGAIPVVSTSGINKQTRIIQAVGGAKSQGVSLIPDIKSQLARTPSGGVILVQRMPTKAANTQVGPGVQKITVSQRQQTATGTSTQGPAKQTIILQSPTSSPPPLVASSGKVFHTTQGQASKRVLTETAQTLPVPEGTVEITRTLTETLTDRKASLPEVMKARAASTTSYARLPGLSPIKPPGSLVVTKSSAASIGVKTTNIPVVNIKQPSASAVTTKQPAVSRSTKSTDASTETSGSLITTTGVSDVTSTKPAAAPSSSVNDESVSLEVTPTVLEKDADKVGAEQPVKTVDDQVSLEEGTKPDSAAQLNPTNNSKGKKIIIKTEPADDSSDSDRGTTEVAAKAASSSIGNNVVSAASKGSQDEVLKVAVERIVKKEAPVQNALRSSAGSVKLPGPAKGDPTVTRLAEPTSRVIITKLTSPPVVTTSATTVDESSSIVSGKALASLDTNKSAAVSPTTSTEAVAVPSTTESGLTSPGSSAPSAITVTATSKADEGSSMAVTRETATPSSTESAMAKTSLAQTENVSSMSGVLASSNTRVVTSVGMLSTDSTPQLVSQVGLPLVAQSGRNTTPEELREETNVQHKVDSQVLLKEPDVTSYSEEKSHTDPSSNQLESQPISSTQSISQAIPSAIHISKPVESSSTLKSDVDSEWGPDKTQVSHISSADAVSQALASSALLEKQTAASETIEGPSSSLSLVSSVGPIILSETTSVSDIDETGTVSTSAELVSQREVSSQDLRSQVSSSEGSTLCAMETDSPVQAVSLGQTNLSAHPESSTKMIQEGLTALIPHIKQEPMEGSTDNTSSGILPTAATSTPVRARTYLDQPGLLKWCAKLNSKISEHISLYNVRTMEQLIRRIVKAKPLCIEDRNIEELPYSATSLHEFQSWPIGKKRAAEWQRGVDVRRMAYRLVPRVVELWNEKIWTTKQIVKWCRRHGYTPGDRDIFHDESIICDLCGVAYYVEPSSTHTCKTKWLSDIGVLRNPTYSIPDDWCKNLKDLQESKEKDLEEVVLIDVVTTSPGKQITPKIEIKEEDGLDPKISIPPSSGAMGVTEEANKMGIHFKSLEASDRVYAPIVEEMVFTAAKQFLSDLLHLSHEQAFQSLSKKRVPTEIHPIHVHQAIGNTSFMDFLTNHRTGVLSEIPGSGENS